MSNTIEFKTRDQREYDKICDRADENLKTYEEMMKKKKQKQEMGGSLSNKDTEEMILGMAMIFQDCREMDAALEKFNPEAVAKMKQIENEAFKNAKNRFLEEEHGIKIIK